MPNLPVIFLMGPTAAGKTDLAAALCGQFDAELISVDAAQVYRGMDIGTAKPPPEFLRRYPHHLIDIRAPNATYSAAEFCADALRLIAGIQARGKLPILVGGSLFYFAALEHGLSELPAADVETRKQINAEIKQRGLGAMHKRLQSIDAALAAAIRPSDRQRIQRALEIHRLTGRAPSEVMQQTAPQALPFALIKLGLFTSDRKQLHARIEARFKRMLERGLVDEARAIAAAFGDDDDIARLPAMRIVGYRQALGFIRNELTCDEILAQGIAATRQLAKRQLTWMRQQRNLAWADTADGLPTNAVCAYLQNHIDRIN